MRLYSQSHCFYFSMATQFPVYFNYSLNDRDGIDVDVSCWVSIGVLELNGVGAIAQRGWQAPTLLPHQATILIDRVTLDTINPHICTPTIGILREVHCELCPCKRNTCTGVLLIREVIRIIVGTHLAVTRPAASVLPSGIGIIICAS